MSKCCLNLTSAEFRVGKKKGRMIPRMMGQEDLGTNPWTIVRLCKIRNGPLHYTEGLDMTSLAKTSLLRTLFSRKTKIKGNCFHQLRNMRGEKDAMER